MKSRAIAVAFLPGLLLLVPPASARGQQGSKDAPDARSIVKAALDYWRDTSSFLEIAMTVHRPSGSASR